MSFLHLYKRFQGGGAGTDGTVDAHGQPGCGGAGKQNNITGTNFYWAGGGGELLLDNLLLPWSHSVMLILHSLRWICVLYSDEHTLMQCKLHDKKF